MGSGIQVTDKANELFLVSQLTFMNFYQWKQYFPALISNLMTAT